MSRRTIVVRSTPSDPLKKEWLADAALRPGMLVEYASGTSIQVLSGTEDPTLRVVIESGDKVISATYAAADLVPFVMPRAGDEVVLCATSSALATLSATNKLVSDGAGFGIYAASPIVGEAIAEVMETATISADGVTQIRCEVL